MPRLHRHAEQGVAFAQISLGSMYDNGQDVVPDYAEAVKWHWRSASRTGSPTHYLPGCSWRPGQTGQLSIGGDLPLGDLLDQGNNTLVKRCRHRHSLFISHTDCRHRWLSIILSKSKPSVTKKQVTDDFLV